MAIRAKTHTYRTAVRWTGERKGTIAAAGKREVQVATPPEFKGHAGIWSPEDLYVASANVCVMTTFLALAERAGLALDSYESEAEGTLEFVDGRFAFTRIVLRPRIRIPAGAERGQAEELIHKAETNCLISHSMRTEVVVEPQVEAGGGTRS